MRPTVDGSLERVTHVRPLPELGPDAHKGDAGRLLCLAGSATMPGAAVLVVRAACRAGAGLVSLGCLSESLLSIVPIAAPEALLVDMTDWRELLDGGAPGVLDGRRDDARAVGPGLGRGELTRSLLRFVVQGGFRGPTVLDADALNEVGALEELREARAVLVLTPHPGEAARLLGRDVPGDDAGRLAAAREIATRANAVCCLKGRASVVVSPEAGRVFVNTTGNPGMATGGSGDVLTGILGAYLAASAVGNREHERTGERFSVFDAAVAAVHVHGRAGDLAADRFGRRALVASDLIECLPAAQRELAADPEAPAR